ncbi:MAG: UbiA family prenyltransferase [Planctomycetes bacterium]|nr:UbiA family prenyltransferase [Planctomycetota bacterium]
MNFVAWGRLLRLSLLPTALADIAAGAVWAQGGYRLSGLGICMLMLASLCVYHGGMALNDWADRHDDARTRPGRPLPSGAVSPRAALAVGVALLVLAPLLAFRVDRLCGFAILGVSVCAAAYDFIGRGAWLGPSLLALCRAGNLGAGVLLGVRYGETLVGGDVVLQPKLAFLPLAYGAFVFAVSRVGRLEDVETPLGRRPVPWIVVGVALLASPLLVPVADVGPTWYSSWDLVLEDGDWPLATWQVRTLVVGLLAWAAWAPLRLAFTVRTWTGALATQATGMLLRRLLVFTAAVAISRGSIDGLCIGGAILCGYPLAFALRRVFPPS